MTPDHRQNWIEANLGLSAGNMSPSSVVTVTDVSCAVFLPVHRVRGPVDGVVRQNG
jgi:hypothetical protein